MTTLAANLSASLAQWCNEDAVEVDLVFGAPQASLMFDLPSPQLSGSGVCFGIGRTGWLFAVAGGTFSEIICLSCCSIEQDNMIKGE